MNEIQIQREEISNSGIDLQNLIVPICEYYNSTTTKPTCSISKSAPPPTGTPRPTGGPACGAPQGPWTSTSWAAPVTTGASWVKSSNATNATPSAPMQYYGNTASSNQIIGTGMLVAFGAVVAMFL